MDLLEENASRLKVLARANDTAYRSVQDTLPDYSLDMDRCGAYVRRVVQAGGAAAAEKMATILASVHYIPACELIAALDT